MSNRLSMNKISEVLRLRFELKRSYRDIANSLNIGTTTVADYLSRAKAVGIAWPLPTEISEQELYDKLFLPVRVAKKTRPEPNWEYVYKELRKKGVTQQLLWREYREEHPTGYGYSQFCHSYANYAKIVTPTMRQIYKAGEKAFVDYSGLTMQWIEPHSGEIFKAEVFVGCLGASQLIFAEATATQQLPDWISSHINMFEYFDGTTEIIVPDNLKSGVTKAHRYDPDINRNYQHFAEHYGVAIVPARAAKPGDKSKAEISVRVIETQIIAPLRHVTFTSLGEINAAIKQRLTIINNQQFQKMKPSRRELFEEIDKPALKPLPSARYQYAEWKKAKINVDYHIAFGDHYYSVPYKMIGKKVDIRATSKTIECFYHNTRVAAHQRSYKKYAFTTLNEHMPKAHQEHAKFSADSINCWAKRIGENTASFVSHMMDSRAFPQQAYRACLGLLRLSKCYGDARLEKACKKALLVGAHRYQEVEAILKNKLEEVPVNKTMTISPAHENIRGAGYYQ